MNPDDRKKIERDFKKRLRRILELAALGRGIEIIVRIADQTREGLAEVGKSYDAMMQSELRIPNLHPPKSLPRLFNDPTELERLRLARDIADKLAHALYRHARKLIDKFDRAYGLSTQLEAAYRRADQSLQRVIDLLAA